MAIYAHREYINGKKINYIMTTITVNQIANIICIDSVQNIETN